MAVQTLRIVADENIPYAAEAFGRLGEVISAPGREITRRLVAEADVLVVRSVTPVGRDLLDGSPVRFVASATAGIDHIDAAYLERKHIPFASAAGANAASVAEYVVAALLELARRGGFHLEGKSIGVVGVGNIGSRVADKARALGMRVFENDPPLFRKTGDPRYVPFGDLEGVDFLTFHVPLTRGGPDSTYHSADKVLFDWMERGSVLINTSRGAVVKGAALAEALDAGELLGAVLDVWEDEPAIDTDLLARIDVASPHVAGYSFDGKVAGTMMVFEAASKALGADVRWDVSDILAPDDAAPIVIEAAGRDDEEVIAEAVARFYDINADDARLRAIAEIAAEERSAYFDRLRKEYPRRREFGTRELSVPDADEALLDKLEGLGFSLGASEEG